MKTFYVSKSDANRLAFVQKTIADVRPANVFILVEENRKHVYHDIDCVKLPLKDLNKSANWIDFANNICSDSLLVVDSVLNFIFFGDGKKSYLRDVSQLIGNIIVTDIVPFYTEPYEIFYPFYFLGKEILGYSNYGSFKANHLEEKPDGTIDFANSFSVLRDKISGHYVQDYDRFFGPRTFVEFQMSEAELAEYSTAKAKFSDECTNPIKLYTECSWFINMIQSRYDAIQIALAGTKKPVLITNCSSFFNRHRKRLGNSKLAFATFHEKSSFFNEFEEIILCQMPVVKPHGWLYNEATFTNDKKIIQLKLTNNNLENYFFSKIFDNSVRAEFDAYFYRKDV